MSKNYTQLSKEQRYQIEALVKAGHTQKIISELVGVHPSTISRELQRNKRRGGNYVGCDAHQRTEERHRKKPKRIKLDDHMRAYIVEKLTDEKFSPELISVTGKKLFGDFVSHERIYQWIWSSKCDYRRSSKAYRKLYQHLRHGRYRQFRGNRNDRRGVVVPNRVSISERPRIVDKRKRLGDYEVDLMIGGFNSGGILVMTDRASLRTKLRKIKSKDSKHVKGKILKCSADEWWIKTMTFDNDSAFALHEKVAEALDIKTYFTRPYTSQDKGTVENRIGVIRRFFPKKTNLALVSDQQIRAVENKLNNRPVRKFNYKTPNQVFSEKIALIT
jgi:IS30 family transposase